MVTETEEQKEKIKAAGEGEYSQENKEVRWSDLPVYMLTTKQLNLLAKRLIILTIRGVFI